MLRTITHYRLQEGDFLSRYLASFPSNSMCTIGKKKKKPRKKSQHLQRTWDLRAGSNKRIFHTQGPMAVYSSADSLNAMPVRAHWTRQVWAQESKIIHFYLFCQVKVSQAWYFTYPQLWNQLSSTPQNMTGLTASIILWALVTNQSHIFENSTHISVRIHRTWLMNSVHFYPQTKDQLLSLWDCSEVYYLVKIS